MSAGGDPRLLRFVRGELSADEIAELETELDRRPSLRVALASFARETARVERHDEAEPPAPCAPPRSTALHEGPERLAVGATLGQGGMGTVREGVQTNLGRAVAVKTLRDETPSGTHRLLQEARLTARLQHPNIVPVHEIIVGHSGELQIVLKQVEGELWSKVMHEPELLRARFGIEDALDWNLGVLVGICNALAYAHERGVIHRDVKPSNVMVGEFGEVYLLDWGIAAMWGERTDHELAHVEDTPFAGTLQYMAPEQVEGDAYALGPWTDIYLLGATLYEVLGGAAPHAEANRGGAPLAPRQRIVPPLGSDAPRELVEIALASLRPEPEDRVFTPQAFRGLVEAFRGHRGSLELVEQGVRSRERANEAHAAGKRAEAERHLGEAELVFRAALEAWPDNTRARAGIVDVAVQRIDAALADGELQVARKLLDALEAPPADLTRRVASASAAEETKLAAARRAAWNRNPMVGLFVRSAVLALFAPAWVLGWGVAAFLPAASTWSFAVLLLGYIVLGTIVVASQGLVVLENQLNRSNLLGAAAALVGALAWTVTAARLELPTAAAQVGILLVFALTSTVVALTSDLRGLLPAGASIGCFVLAAALPEYARHALAANAILVSAGLVLNNVRRRRRLRA